MTDDHEVYLIAQLEVSDRDTFMRDYAGPLQPLNEKHGATVIAASAQAQVLEGEYDRNLTVVLKFPSAAAQQAWYDDPAYQPLIQRRQELTNTDGSTLIVVPAAQGEPA
ncbi:MAG: DUF1330 domain-containing protein [Pseudomonadota bacterium]